MWYSLCKIIHYRQTGIPDMTACFGVSPSNELYVADRKECQYMHIYIIYMPCILNSGEQEKLQINVKS